jgi:hypothetical protein
VTITALVLANALLALLIVSALGAAMRLGLRINDN